MDNLKEAAEILAWLSAPHRPEDFLGRKADEMIDRSRALLARLRSRETERPDGVPETICAQFFMFGDTTLKAAAINPDGLTDAYPSFRYRFDSIVKPEGEKPAITVRTDARNG